MHETDLTLLRDPQRLAELAALDPFDDQVRRALDDLAQRAASALDSPVGLVSLVLDDAQYMAGRAGVSGWLAEAGGVPADWAPCSQVVVTGEPFVVEDGARDARLVDNPLVAHGELGAYLGVPLRTAGGQVLGALCVLEGGTRSWDGADVDALQGLAREAVEVLESTRAA